MKASLNTLLVALGILILSGCSVFGKSNTETAAYTVLETAQNDAIEVRHYERLVLVSAPMEGGMDEGQDSAFSKLFDYISGNNVARTDIAMTAPVLMGQTNTGSSVEISMTAPVFMGKQPGNTGQMSFVLPASFTMETAPLPKNPDVILHEITDYTVAAIRFSGFLNDSNISKQKAALETWIAEQGYTQTGSYQTAGYNPPYTIPALRRNEVLIPVKKP